MRLAADQDRFFARAASLLKKYDGSPDHRSAFRALLEAGESEGFSDQELALVEGAYELVGKTLVAAQGEPLTLFQEWEEWQFEEVPPPENLARVVFDRLPLAELGEKVWDEILLRDVPPWLPRKVMGRRLVSIKQVKSLAKAQPAAFFRSPVLDAMLERGSNCPDPVWDECVRNSDRPDGLLQPHQILVRCLTLDRRKSAIARFLAILARDRDLCQRALRLLLQEEGTSIRVLDHLLFFPSGSKAKQKKREKEANRAVLLEWVSVASDILQTAGRPEAEAASLVVASAVVAVMGLSPPLAKALQDSESEKILEVSRGLLVTALRQWETGDDRLPRIAIGIDADSLYQAVHEHLSNLPSAREGPTDSPERGARYERFKGRREVLEEILAALEEEPHESPLRDAIEVALFNSGVRDVGLPGQEVLFDSAVHRVARGGTLPGDPVRVLTAGRSIGEGEDRLILRKAEVEPVQ
ncbi:hypothetical protein ACFL0I_01965 [Gemmatimonadota bacterium]